MILAKLPDWMITDKRLRIPKSDHIFQIIK